MPAPRDGFRALLLGDGTVLVVGDDHRCMPGGALPGSETATIYDPGRDVWRAVASLNKPRIQFAAVPTLDGGVVVIGGVNEDEVPFSSTKLFDTPTGTWRNGPLLELARANPVAVALGDGRIVVASPTKFEETSTTSTSEIYAPPNGQWANGDELDGLAIEQLIALTDGRLLGVGSEFEISGSMMISTPGRSDGWARFPGPDTEYPGPTVPLPDGDILALGVPTKSADRPTTAAVSRYRRAKDRWVGAAPMRTPRVEPITAMLPDGQVLVAGGQVLRPGFGHDEITTVTEIYDPSTDAWSPGPDLREPRMSGYAVTLTDGTVMVLGGIGVLDNNGDTPFCPGPLTSVERLTVTP